MTPELPPPASPPPGTVGPRTTCARHPRVETALRCPSCGTPICPKCLVYTPVGAKCPTCARGPRVRRPTVSLATYLGCGAAGLAVGMVSGIVLSVAPLGALFFLPLLLTGVLVGEAVSAVARRRAARGLAGLAFGCAVVGPILGQAALLAPRLPVADPTVRAHLTLAVALQSLGPLGLLLLAVAGAVAASRITRGW